MVLQPPQKACVQCWLDLRAWHPELLYCPSVNWKAQLCRMIVTKAGRKFLWNRWYITSIHIIVDQDWTSWMRDLKKLKLQSTFVSSLPCHCLNLLSRSQPARSTRDKYFLAHDDPVLSVRVSCVGIRKSSETPGLSQCSSSTVAQWCTTSPCFGGGAWTAGHANHTCLNLSQAL